MKVPKPRKLPSGTWFIQLRLGGESISVTAASERACIKEAQAIKAEYLAGKRAPKPPEPEEKQIITLTQAIDDYIAAKRSVLSPATIRGYRNIQKHRFPALMDQDVDHLAQLSTEEWQRIVSAEAKLCAPKTLKSSYSLLKTVIQQKTLQLLPRVTLSAPVKKETDFLSSDEILVFVKAVAKTDVSIPALLALSSMRLSEIQALDWADIAPKPDFIHVKGSVVPDEHHHLQKKSQNKNVTSDRYVPILIPELRDALERSRMPDGPVMACSRSYLLKQVHKICKEQNITDVTIHGLRHSFASLAYKLGIPEKAAMDIGGWADTGTMHKIYTHIARKDIDRYKGALSQFYENANKNANNENEA